NIADNADCIGKLFRSGDDSLEAAFGEGTVADLAPARAANRLALSHAKGREVVIEHEFLGILVRHAVHTLLVGDGAERDGDERVRFAALKNGRTVCARQDADFAVELSDVLDAAAVDALAFENEIADNTFFESADSRSDLFGRMLPAAVLREELGVNA